MTDSPLSQRVLESLSKAREEIERLRRPMDQRVAIVGMAARLPGAESVEEFWDLLRQGKSGVRELTDEELIRAVGKQLAPSDYVRRYASFESPTDFDANFFGYSPREADLLDPQHRVFLECAWTAWEDAGYDSRQYAGLVGVYAGAALNSYLVNLHSDHSIRESVNQVQAVVSNVLGLMPTRVSYHLDLQGPSCGIQTGCSTSLVAVHTACRSLLDGDCDMALAGGVTIGQPNPTGYQYEEGSIASPDGRCRAFDAEGQGTIFGNGVGIVVLKRLQQAIDDGDNIHAVILGSAINNDGSDKVGLLAPSVSGQAAVIASAIKRAQIDPATISYVEAHGTATELGDPVELAALDQAMGAALKQASARCAVGSVKSNLGHLDAAAGIAGLIKVVLALQHRELPPSLDFSAANPQLDLAARPFFVNDRLTSWKAQQHPRRAGVSSFGMGGTNAHVILEEAPTVDLAGSAADGEWNILPLSAKTSSALEFKQQQLARFLSQQQTEQKTNLTDIAYTLQVGRRAMPHRRAVVCQHAGEVAELFEDNTQSTAITNTSPPVVFLFSGQGSQYADMARQLYDQYPQFRQQIERCAEILAPEFDLLEVLYGQPSRSVITNTASAQPALFAIEYALANLLISWGIRPAAMIGHSLGEYVAACLAGVFTLEDAVRIVRLRGELMQQCQPGSMLAVLCEESTLNPFLGPQLEIAARNSRSQIVVSGPKDDIAQLQTQLQQREITCQLLATSHAFHSSMMEPALEPFRQCLSEIARQPPQLDVISNRTGTWLTAEDAINPDYWVRHLRQTVLFADGVRVLGKLDNPLFLEVGPGRTLCRLVQSQLDEATTIASLPGEVDQQSEDECFTRALASLWLQGVEIDWVKTHVHKRGRVSLPTYPFERTRHFVELAEHKPATTPTEPCHEKNSNVDDWFWIPTWQTSPPSAQTTKPAEKCLIFADPQLRESLAGCLSHTNAIWVMPGESWQQEEDSFTIHPDRVEDYGRLWDALKGNEGGSADADWQTAHIIHLWSLRDKGQRSFRCLVTLSQSLIDRLVPTMAWTLDVITSGTTPELGEQVGHLAGATLPGLLNVLPQELPGLQCRLIDIDGSQELTEIGGDRFSPVLRQLKRELALDTKDRHLALRGSQRWIKSYQPWPLPAADAELLEAERVYLVVGDLVDGLGMVYAAALRQHLSARVILIGPHRLPSVHEWDGWLATHGNRHPVSQLIGRLKALGREGDDFCFETVNFSDAAQLRQAIDHALSKLGSNELQGVFYADLMGGEASCALVDLTEEQEQRILDSRLASIAALANVLPGLKPEFVVLQSSLAAIVGGPGFAAYAAASTYLDAFTASANANELHLWPCPVISINWDACQLDESTAAQNSELMALALTPAEVWEATVRVLANPVVLQVIVSPRPLLQRLVNSQPAVQQSPPHATKHSRRQLQNEYVAARNDIERIVAKAMGDLLGVPDIGIHDDFFALGGHSLLAIQAVTKLRKKFQVELPMRVVLQGTPTVAGIAQVIEENMTSITAQDATVVEDLLEKIEAESF